MKISEFVKKNEETLPKELAKILNDSESIWSNDACYGYCIVAMQNAGFKRDEIVNLIHYLHSAFEEYTPEEAEKEWVNF